MKKWYSKLFIVFILALAFSYPLLFTVPAKALTTPDDDMSIDSVLAVQDTVQDGDISIVFKYDIPYATPPTTPASYSIIFNLYASDGTTLLQSTVPYSYYAFSSYGYKEGVGSFYLTPTEATALWNTALKIVIVGSPAYYDPPPTASKDMTTADFSIATTQAESQQDMKDYIIDICEQLELTYSSVTLHGSTDAGVVFSSYGESYFRGAVPGIQAISPALFYAQMSIPTATPPSYDSSLVGTYGGRLTGTDLMSGFTAIGTNWLGGVSGEFVAAGFFFILALIPPAITVRKNWGAEIGLVAAGVVLMLGGLLVGGANLVVAFFMAFVGAILAFIPLLLRRA